MNEKLFKKFLVVNDPSMKAGDGKWTYSNGIFSFTYSWYNCQYKCPIMMEMNQNDLVKNWIQQVKLSIGDAFAADEDRIISDINSALAVVNKQVKELVNRQLPITVDFKSVRSDPKPTKALGALKNNQPCPWETIVSGLQYMLQDDMGRNFVLDANMLKAFAIVNDCDVPKGQGKWAYKHNILSYTYCWSADDRCPMFQVTKTLAKSWLDLLQFDLRLSTSDSIG